MRESDCTHSYETLVKHRIDPVSKMSNNDNRNTGYDINDPRTMKHTAYKISQANAIAARERYKQDYDDDDDEDSDVDLDQQGLERAEERLRNAQEARYHAFEYVHRTYKQGVSKSILTLCL